MIAWAKKYRWMAWPIFFIGAFVAGWISAAVGPKQPVGKIDASFVPDGDSFTIVNHIDGSRYCYMLINNKYSLGDINITDQYNKFKWTDFKNKDGKIYNKSLEPLKKLHLHCGKPTEREIYFTQ